MNSMKIRIVFCIIIILLSLIWTCIAICENDPYTAYVSHRDSPVNCRSIISYIENNIISGNYQDYCTDWCCTDWRQYVQPIGIQLDVGADLCEIRSSLIDNIIGGKIDMRFRSQDRIVLPISCLDVYSPYYMPIEEWGDDYCFVDVNICCKGRSILSTWNEECSYADKAMYVICMFSLYPNEKYNSNLTVSVTCKYLDCQGQIVENTATVDIAPVSLDYLVNKGYEGVLYEDQNIRLKNIIVKATALASFADCIIQKVNPRQRLNDEYSFVIYDIENGKILCNGLTNEYVYFSRAGDQIRIDFYKNNQIIYTGIYSLENLSEM